MKPKDVEHPMECPACGSKAVCVRSTIVYGKDYGWMYVCSRFPECDTYCGCHKGTKHPLGTMADKETRELRKQVHAAFDPLWKSKAMSRDEAYQALCRAMLIDWRECHVGMFNALRCKAALDCIRRIKAELPQRGYKRLKKKHRSEEDRFPSVTRTGANYVPSETDECPFEV